MSRYYNVPTYAPAIYNLKAALRTGRLSRIDKHVQQAQTQVDSTATTGEVAEANAGHAGHAGLEEGLGGLQIGAVKDDEYWFDDGSVVLATSTRLFCVHKSILSVHSGLFNTLFTLPQPETNEEGEVMDGLPMITLSDEPGDVKLLLHLCYDRRFYNHMSCTYASFPTILSILRVTNKYELDVVRAEVLNDLEFLFPTYTSRQPFDRLGELVTSPLTNGLSSNAITLPNTDAMLEFIAVAQTCRAELFLPCIYYWFCVEFTVPRLEMLTDPDKFAFPLSKRDKDRILSGRKKLADIIKNTLDRWYNDQDSWLCGRECRDSRRQVIREWIEPHTLSIPYLRVNPNLTVPPVDVFERFGEDAIPVPIALHDDSRSCYGCVEATDRFFGEARRDTWERLPEIFGLGTWEGLVAAST